MFVNLATVILPCLVNLTTLSLTVLMAALVNRNEPSIAAFNSFAFGQVTVSCPIQNLVNALSLLIFFSEVGLRLAEIDNPLNETDYGRDTCPTK